MQDKEAKARVKINKLLEYAGWRFFESENGPANIVLENRTKITQSELDAIGNDFQTTKSGYIDFLLLDTNGFPIAVLEAKREGLHPLEGKEQAREYAYAQKARFIILSNGNSHYFWDTQKGSPEVIIEFPTQESLGQRKAYRPDPSKLTNEIIGEDYIALTQKPNFKQDPHYQNQATKEQYIESENLRLLRKYQIEAIKALQNAAATGKERYLFEMATGTGKTLTAAAVIKLFLRTGNAKRVLFLVDRIELEDQAEKNFVRYLKNDYTTLIYKENRDDWKRAEIVVSTVQSLSAQDKYKKYFSPTDFDLIISDEAHRSIGGNSRAVFEYFLGYKLGLTATPKDYLKNIEPQEIQENDPRAWERRQLLDTYKTFGCDSGEPTYRYTLLDGVKDGFLINPMVVDARTEITTELLSEKGYAVVQANEEGIEEEKTFYERDFERKFFSERTNLVFCQTFLQHALKDPISGEIGKSIVFCVSQDHALRITQLLNQLADKLWPDKYQSDFAVRVTSNEKFAQADTIRFANNNLKGKSKFLEGYFTSKTRICVTVGMMTTGYDCQDILNVVLMRPIFSPTDFVQIKGRGTRTFTFKYIDNDGQPHNYQKIQFKLFDYFANCEYFEKEFQYDEILKLPAEISAQPGPDVSPTPTIDGNVNIFDPDQIKTLEQTQIGLAGMKIDRMLFERAKERLQGDDEIRTAVENEQWDRAVQRAKEKYEDQPDMYLSLDRIRKAENLDRRLTWREVLERAFGFIDKFKSKDQKLEDECEKFISIYKPDSKYVPYIKNYLKAYASDEKFRTIINNKDYTELRFYPAFSMEEFQALNGYRELVPEYIKDYVQINTYL